MRTEQLRYFIEVAQTNSLTKAAEKLFIAPQSLSESITRLENEFGVRLFFRTSSGMRLTEVGEVFLEHAYAMLAEYERTIEHLRYFQQPQPALYQQLYHNRHAAADFAELLPVGTAQLLADI